MRARAQPEAVEDHALPSAGPVGSSQATDPFRPLTTLVQNRGPIDRTARSASSRIPGARATAHPSFLRGAPTPGRVDEYSQVLGIKPLTETRSLAAVWVALNYRRPHGILVRPDLHVATSPPARNATAA